MKRFLIVFFIFFISFYVKSQEFSHQINYKVGMGFSLLGTGDMWVYSLDNELTVSLNKYFSGAIAYNVGQKSIKASSTSAERFSNYHLAGVGINVAPFSNERRNVFSIGTGISYFNQNSVYKSTQLDDYPIYDYNSSKAFSMQIGLANEYKINDNISFGGKVFSNATIRNGVNISGLVFRVGYKFE